MRSNKHIHSKGSVPDHTPTATEKRNRRAFDPKANTPAYIIVFRGLLMLGAVLGMIELVKAVS